MTKKATEYYHGSEGYNCAQAVAAAWQDRNERGDLSLLEKLRSCGGGRAPGGICGALHAAHTILRDQGSREEGDRLFLAEAGSLSCKEIRALGRLSCAGCVALADSYLSGPAD